MGEPAAVHGVRGLDHVGLNVPDLQQAVRFFVEVFGARVVFTVDRFDDADGSALGRLGVRPPASLAIVMLQLGEGSLELLGWHPQSAAWPDAEAPGASHVAIDVDDLDAALDTLRARDDITVLGESVTFIEGPTPGLANAFVRTSWGLLVELVCWTQGRP